MASRHCDVAFGSAIGSAVHSASRRERLASLVQDSPDRDEVGSKSNSNAIDVCCGWTYRRTNRVL